MKWIQRDRRGVGVVVPVFWLRGVGYRIETDTFTRGGWAYVVGLRFHKEWRRVTFAVSWGKVALGAHMEVA